VITKRDKRYGDGRPHQAVETEALKQTVLIGILRTRLNRLLSMPLEDVLEREAEERDQIERLLTTEGRE
jgi:hypothetical protein